MELEDTDDVPEEFKGGTLQFSPDDLKNAAAKSDLINSNSKLLVSSNSTERVDSCNNINKNRWESTLISPIVSIPHRITESIWSKKSSNKEDNATSLKPTAAQISFGNANDFFTFRQGIVEQAIKECVEQFLDAEADGMLWAAYLLTEISLWDTDKERLILLTPKTIVIVKYDFIALRRLEYKKLPFSCIDTVIIGDLVYPAASLVPNRNMRGVRLMWNNGKPLNFGNKWNPLSNDVPVATFTSHPLFFHKDCSDEDQKKAYNIEEFIENICSAVSEPKRNCNESPCMIHHKDIVLDNYIGVGSLIHNRNALGFFKVRGKFSF